MATDNDLRALTVRQPWASWIADGTKWLEMRSRPTRYRGGLYIHAGLNGRSATDGRPRGAIIAVASIVDAVMSDQIAPHEQSAQQAVCDFSARAAWRLVDVVPLVDPVPCRGALGLWRPAPDVIAAVMRQLR